MSPDPQNAPERCFQCGGVVGAEATLRPVGGDVRAFCCPGCAEASQLAHELGPGTEPGVSEALSAATASHDTFERFDDPLLQRSFVTFEADGERSATLSVGGMRCAACSWRLEEELGRVPGLCEVQVGLANQRARVRWQPDRVRLSEILERVCEIGFRAAPFEPDAEEALVRSERRAALRRLGVAGLGTMQVMMFSVALYAGALGDLERLHRDLLRVASWIVATPVLAYAGLPFLVGAWRDLRAWRVGPDVPIALALVGAYAASARATTTGTGDVYFDSVCMFILFITLGRTLEREIRARSELRIRGLRRRTPETAHRLEASEEKHVPVALLREGDVVAIHPGERVPADGIVLDGTSEASESLLTGEETPVPKQPGSRLLAGSHNFDGSLRMRVERTGPASTLQQIATLLDRAQLEKPPIALLADRLARVFLTSVVFVAAFVGLVWWQIDAARAVPIVISVLIATCPCALSLATPAALAAASHGLASRGLLITRGHVLEALARVTRVVFDKTGTLTTSVPELVGVRTLCKDLDASAALALAVRLERGSSHPLARALRSAAPTGSEHATADVKDRHAEPGAGVSGSVAGRKVRLGRPDWAAALSGAPVEPLNESGGATVSPVLLADERGPLAWFRFDTQLRAGADPLIAWLDAAGYASALLSGDPSKRGVESTASRLGLQSAQAGASPEAKLAALDAWIEQGDTVLAVGDGVNDAPLLGRAQVSIAMGSGSDLARVKADAVLLDDRLESIATALRSARRARRVMRQNFAWALAYNLSVLPLAVTGMLPPYLAAIGMSASSLLVVGNSLRLSRPPREPSARAAASGAERA